MEASQPSGETRSGLLLTSKNAFPVAPVRAEEDPLSHGERRRAGGHAGDRGIQALQVSSWEFILLLLGWRRVSLTGSIARLDTLISSVYL